MGSRGRRGNGAVLGSVVALGLVGALGLVACSSDRADASQTGTFTVLSYNVAGLPVEISKERPDVNIPLISPLLEPYDVVLTQEDFDWWKPDGLASTTDFVNYHDRLRADTTHEFRT